MSRARAAAGVLVIAAAGTLPAAAADPAPSRAPSGDAALTAKIDAAISNARSYRIAVRGPNVSVLIRSFGPERVQIDSTAAGATSESIIVGTSMYYRTGEGGWKSYPVPPVKNVRHNRLYMAAADTLLDPLPDRNENGEAVGAFRSPASGNGAVPGTMDCTYDKATFRPRACKVTLRGSSTPLEVSYAGWDDPANVVEPPAGISAPTPAPSANPRASR